MEKISVLDGVVTALSPIVHNQIFEQGYKDNNGNAKAQRTMTFALTDKEGQPDMFTVPVVSGNAVRGVIRRLLFDFSMDSLGVRMSDLFQGTEEQKRVSYFFRNGGLTPKGVAVKDEEIGTHERLRRIPWLGLLGGVYSGHHFGGSMNVGILVPITKETAPICSKRATRLAENDELALPTVGSLAKLDTVRYTRRASELALEREAGDKEPRTDPEAMIFGTQYLPAGVKLDSHNVCISDDEGILKAFYAGFALFANHGMIGGMGSKGHGYIQCDYGIDRATAIADYQDYLSSHKEEILAAVKSIPGALQSKAKEKAAAKEG